MVELIKSITSNTIESANFYWAGISFLAWLRAFYWKRAKNDQGEAVPADEGTIIVASSLQWMFMATTINPLWFAVSRFMAGEGGLWHDLMFQYRVFLILGTVTMFSVGTIKLFCYLEGKTFHWPVAVCSGVTAWAFTLGFY